MISNSTVSLFYQNFNGVRDKLLTLERLISSYEFGCIIEHLVCAYNVSQLDLSCDHKFILGPAKLTSGRPSGGLAIPVNKKFSCSLSESSDVYISVDFCSFILMCVYIPTNYRNESSS